MVKYGRLESAQRQRYEWDYLIVSYRSIGFRLGTQDVRPTGIIEAITESAHFVGMIPQALMADVVGPRPPLKMGSIPGRHQRAASGR